MKKELNVNGMIIPYEIVRSSRRTMAIQVTREGSVVIRVPNRTLDAGAAAFAEKNAHWIFLHYTRRKQANDEKKEFVWRDGAVLLYKGREVKLSVILQSGSKKISVRKTENILSITGDMEAPEQIADAVIQWYKLNAAEVFVPKVERIAADMNVDYGRISVRSQKKRWGSCSAAGNISLNWKLLMLPEELMDYVIVHELCHRLEMNHSLRFWNEVGRVLPDYKVYRRRLRDYEDQIISEF